LSGSSSFFPALGIALVKPCVVGTTARASKENVRSIGYSIYYTMVNIGGAAGPLFASWAHRHLGVESVYRVSALFVFAMFFVVLILLSRAAQARRRPAAIHRHRRTEFLCRSRQLSAGSARPDDRPATSHRACGFIPQFNVPWWIWVGLLVLVLAGISRFMWFLVLFTGFWIVFWQQYISLPGYIHGFINPHADVEIILVTDGLAVICLTLAINFLTRKIPAFQAVILGTLITSVSWIILISSANNLGSDPLAYLFSPSARSFSNRATTNTSLCSRHRDSKVPTWALRSCRSALAR
jgi:proton-dependent oligopeptide transporter, POT family